MRVSSDPLDPAYAPDLIGTAIRIELDGQIIEKVITADEEAGTVLSYATDDKGEVLLTEDGRNAQTVECSGRVVIHLPTNSMSGVMTAAQVESIRDLPRG